MVRSLVARSIPTLAELQRQFLDHWEVKKDPLQITSEYTKIKWNVDESMQDYYIRFDAVYNAIPDDLRPFRKSCFLKFPYGFDPDMAYQLRERDPTTLEEMQKITISVEANLNDKRDRLKAEKKFSTKEEASTSDQVLHKVENMIERLTLDKPKPKIQNPISVANNNHNSGSNNVISEHKN